MPDPDTRADKLLKLIEQYGQTPDDYDAGEEEDPRPYLDGSRELERYALVTVNYTSHGHAKFFFLAFDSLAVAFGRGVLYADDDTFEELPVQVVDLDNGQTWVPSWSALPWKSGIVPGSYEEAQAIQRAAEDQS